MPNGSGIMGIIGAITGAKRGGAGCPSTPGCCGTCSPRRGLIRG